MNIKKQSQDDFIKNLKNLIIPYLNKEDPLFMKYEKLKKELKISILKTKKLKEKNDMLIESYNKEKQINLICRKLNLQLTYRRSEITPQQQKKLINILALMPQSELSELNQYYEFINKIAE